MLKTLDSFLSQQLTCRKELLLLILKPSGRESNPRHRACTLVLPIELPLYEYFSPNEYVHSIRLYLRPNSCESASCTVHTLFCLALMEQIVGVAPAYSVWKTDILLLNYICIWLFLVNEVAILKRFVSPLTSYASFALRFH